MEILKIMKVPYFNKGKTINIMGKLTFTRSLDRNDIFQDKSFTYEKWKIKPLLINKVNAGKSTNNTRANNGSRNYSYFVYPSIKKHKKFATGGNIYSWDLEKNTFKDNVENILNSDWSDVKKALRGYAMALARSAQGKGGEQYAKSSLSKDTYAFQYHLNQAKQNKFADPGQDAFLFSKEEQEQAFLNSGYSVDATKDYGLVKKAVGNRNLPVYQKNTDVIPRDSLTVVGNPNIWLGKDDEELEHAGSYPTALYIDRNGNFYQQAWDLQDYGDNSAGNKGYTYGRLRQWVANTIDKIGNPLVRKSGIRPITNVRDAALQMSTDMSDSTTLYKLYEFLSPSQKNDIVQSILENQYHWMLGSEDFQSSLDQSEVNRVKQELSKKGHYSDFEVYQSLLPFDTFKANLNKYFSKELLHNLGIPKDYYDQFVDFAPTVLPYTPYNTYDNSYNTRKSR